MRSLYIEILWSLCFGQKNQENIFHFILIYTYLYVYITWKDETWKDAAPMVIPRKFQMKQIDGEPLSQTQRREKQVMYNFQTDIELLQLRADSHEEKCQTIDKAMEELISQKTTGQRRAMIIQLWKKVQVGKDQEKAQSEKDFHSKNRGGKKPN